MSPNPYLGDLQGQSGSWGAYTQVHFQVQFSGEPKGSLSVQLSLSISQNHSGQTVPTISGVFMACTKLSKVGLFLYYKCLDVDLNSVCKSQKKIHCVNPLSTLTAILCAPSHASI